MPETRLSFIYELTKGNQQAWKSFDRSYKPLLIRWMKKYSLSDAQAQDITQDVMMYLFENVSRFDHNGNIGSFRAWLRNITVNIVRNFLRKNKKDNLDLSQQKLDTMLEQLIDPNSDLSKMFDYEHTQAMILVLLSEITPYFKEKNLVIFRQHVLEGLSADEIAAKHGIAKPQVYIIRSRVLRKLRDLDIDWLEDLFYDQ